MSRPDDRLPWLEGLCSSAESALADGPGGPGAAMLDRVLEPMAALGGGAGLSCRKAVRRLAALRRALDRVRPGDGAVVAHKAVLVMWQALFLLRRSLGAGPRVRFSPRRLLVPALWCLALFAAALTIAAVRDAVIRDAASLIRYDLLADTPQGVALAGIRGVERDGPRTWRWIDGPRACLAVPMPKGRKAVLRFSVMNPIPGQRLTVLVNDNPVGVFDNMPPGSWGGTQREELVVDLRRGANVVCFDTLYHNHTGFAFAPDDPSPYALAFTEMTLTALP